MKKSEKKIFGREFMALSQVSILIMAIFAFAFIVGDMRVVSGWEVGDIIEFNNGGSPMEIVKVNPDGTLDVLQGREVLKGISPSDLDVVSQEPGATTKVGGLLSGIGSAYSISTSSLDSPPELTPIGPIPVSPPSVDSGSIPPERPSVGDGGTVTDITNAPDPNFGGEVSKETIGLKESFLNLYKINNGGVVDGIIAGAAWAVTVGTLVKVVGGFLGVDDNKVNAIAFASAGGLLVGKTVQGLVGGVGNQGTFFGLSPGVTGIIAGGATAIAIFLIMYKNEETKIITFECLPWEAPIGGEHCEACNEQGILPCSEYQCRSLGQACELINKGSEEERCAWINRNDVAPPVISLWQEALTPGHTYTPDNAISPPDRGVKILSNENQNGCIEAFTPLSFGIELDEPGKCKIDYLRKSDFDSMQFYMGGSPLLRYNHTQVLSLPGPNVSGESPVLQNDGDFSLHVRCQDANGNYNTGTFAFNFCVDEGPDTTPPLIVTTDILEGSPIAFNQSEIRMSVFTNEPADCRWSQLDETFNDMDNEFTCAQSITEMNAQLLYRCTGNLTGLKSREKNQFYFRCKDQPLADEASRNVNMQSYKFSLIGTQPLVIDSVGPNETVRDSTDAVRVTLEAETSAGYKDGKAVCYYSATGNVESYIEFFNTDSHEHSQDLFLPEGNYEYFIKCIDLGGNQDLKSTKFKVETDTDAPRVARAFNEEGKLKLVTTEEAECVYDTKSCNYQLADGIKFTTVDEDEHFTTWNSKTTFYVKCQDEFGNQPLPNQCSIIVRPFDTYKGED